MTTKQPNGNGMADAGRTDGVKRREGPSQHESLAKPLQPIPAHHLPTPDSLRRSVGTCNRCMPARLHSRSWGRPGDHNHAPRDALSISCHRSRRSRSDLPSSAPHPQFTCQLQSRRLLKAPWWGGDARRQKMPFEPPLPPADQSSVKGSDCRVPSTTAIGECFWPSEAVCSPFSRFDPDGQGEVSQPASAGAGAACPSQSSDCKAVSK